MSEVSGVIKRWWVALLFGIAAIIIGVLVFIYPGEGYYALSYVFAAYFVVYGLYKSIFTYMEREEIPAWGWSFALGIITLILGLMLLFIPGYAPGVLVYYVAFSLMFMGINSCSTAFIVKEAGDKSWWWALVLGILTIILSLFILFDPLLGALYTAYLAAATFFVFGVECCVLAYRLSVLNSELKKS